MRREGPGRVVAGCSFNQDRKEREVNHNPEQRETFLEREIKADDWQLITEILDQEAMAICDL